MSKIPANKPGILPLVINKPVRYPATAPAKKAIIVARTGCTSLTIRAAATAPPKGKLPSSS